jgi:hypothetical protein
VVAEQFSPAIRRIYRRNGAGMSPASSLRQRLSNAIAPRRLDC